MHPIALVNLIDLRAQRRQADPLPFGDFGAGEGRGDQQAFDLP